MHAATSLHPRPFARLLSLILLLLPLLPGALTAKDAHQPPPASWPVAASHQSVSRAVVARTLTEDEVWSVETPRHQILDTGDATRTVMLAPVAPNSLPPGTWFAARVTTRNGNRILFRRSDGELLAFWGSNEASQTKWITLTATDAGWEARVSSGKALSHADPALAFLGADLRPSDDFVRPASARTNGYAIRFGTDSPLLYVSCRANHPRFRVIADGRLVADIDVDDTSGTRLLLPVELGDTKPKKIEILADTLEFGSVEVPDVRTQLHAWPAAVPAVRMLWIGDSSAELGTHAYPWLAGNLLGYEVWSRSWGHHAQHVAGANRNAPPLAAIDEDVAAVNPDVIVISGHFFDEQLSPRAYTAVVGAWFDAIARASRPESVKIALSAWVNRGPVDRLSDRRASIIAREASRRDFHYVNWQAWIDGNRDDASWGNAHEIISANYIHYTSLGNAYIADCFAGQVQRLRLERKAQLAAASRRQAAADARNIAAAEAGP